MFRARIHITEIMGALFAVMRGPVETLLKPPKAPCMPLAFLCKCEDPRNVI